MTDSGSLADEFADAIEDAVSRVPESITSRACHSDNYAGHEYRIKGEHTPIIPIINVVREHDGLAIEEMSTTQVSEGETVTLVFVAEDYRHSAFSEGDAVLN